jgi:long-chain fatty acid transport protein
VSGIYGGGAGQQHTRLAEAALRQHVEQGQRAVDVHAIDLVDIRVRRKGLSFDFKDNTDKLEDIHSPRNYENTYIIRAGMQYLCKSNCSVRAGAYFDKSPVQDGYLTPETPDADRIGLSTGASWNFSKCVNLDLSLLYIEGMKRSDKNIETQFEGTYKSKVIIPGFGLEVKF